ncbi:hypothetical protein Tco_1564540, partial [Tanacetum coccineum]
RLGRIYSRGIHQMLVLDFESLSAVMSERLTSRMLMEHRDDQGQSVFTSRTWRRFNEVIVDINAERTLQFQLGGARRRISIRLIAYSIAGRSQAPKKVTVYLSGIDVGSVNIPYLLARIDDDCPDLPMIDMAKLVRLQICEELDNTWAWVAPGPERQQVATTGALEVAEGAPDVDEGDQPVLAPVQAPQPPPATGPARTMA